MNIGFELIINNGRGKFIYHSQIRACINNRLTSKGNKEKGKEKEVYSFVRVGRGVIITIERVLLDLFGSPTRRVRESRL
jgi:hypothetical protein